MAALTEQPLELITEYECCMSTGRSFSRKEYAHVNVMHRSVRVGE